MALVIVGGRSISLWLAILVVFSELTVQNVSKVCFINFTNQQIAHSIREELVVAGQLKVIE
jgi:hypothetical protein